MSSSQESASYVASTLSLSLEKTKKVLQLLLEENCTVPFISRYRKEVTGGMDEVQVGSILKEHHDFVEREKRRAYVLQTIKDQGKLTKELEQKILKATSLNIIEDLYAPYKSKKKTKAQVATEAGLAPFAELIKTSKLPLSKILEEHSDKYLSKEKGISTQAEILEGAGAIITEEIAHNSDLKDELRKNFWDTAVLKSQKRKDAEKIPDHEKFKDYFEFEQKITQLKAAKAGHRFLAMRRGMTLKILKVSVSFEQEDALKTITSKTFDLDTLGCFDFLSECIKKSYLTSIYPSLDLEIKSELKLLSDESAINVFGVNLKNLLLSPYLGQKSVMGIDPGIRTGCKVAVIDKNGNFLVDTVIYPHEPRNDIQGSKKAIETCLEKLDIKHIAIGNGTYGRETLEFLKENVSAVKNGKVKAMLVNEDGASIYSASEIAREEFPDKDLTVRGAISIARRFQDPLGELVKIDPKSIGVGQYQHDVSQTKLKKSLGSVVENCVNYVGVDLNTASAPLLSYVSGIGPTLAKNIVEHRSKISGFKSRKELLKVGRFTPKVFEQSAGFLRIYGAKDPLDRTFIHPERYELLEKWCAKKKIAKDELISNGARVSELKADRDFKESVGEFTLEDIAKSLLAPNQDPRTEFVSFEFRTDATGIKDIKKDQYYPGIVTNITQFGAFVDIGIKENGLIHVSQISDKYVENALEVLKVGQQVKARVMDVDLARKRISLSLKSVGAPQNTQNSQAPKKARPVPEKQIRNNAFASLKNLKLK